MLVNQHALNVICEINIIWNSLTALCKLYYKFNWYILTLEWSAYEYEIGSKKKTMGDMAVVLFHMNQNCNFYYLFLIILFKIMLINKQYFGVK